MKTYSLAQRTLLCGGLNGKEIPERGDICTHTADSLCWAAETNTTLLSNYTLKKNFFKPTYTSIKNKKNKNTVQDFPKINKL